MFYFIFFSIKWLAGWVRTLNGKFHYLFFFFFLKPSLIDIEYYFRASRQYHYGGAGEGSIRRGGSIMLSIRLSSTTSTNTLYCAWQYCTTHQCLYQYQYQYCHCQYLPGRQCCHILHGGSTRN